MVRKTTTPMQIKELPDSINKLVHIPMAYPHKEELLHDMKGCYYEDPFFLQVLNSLKMFKNYEVTSNKYIYLKLQDCQVLCVPNLLMGNWCLRE